MRYLKEMNIIDILYINRAKLTFDNHVHFNGLNFIDKEHIKSLFDLVFAQVPLKQDLIDRLISPSKEVGCISLISAKNILLSLVLNRKEGESFFDFSNTKKNYRVPLTDDYKAVVDFYIDHLKKCR